MERVRMKLADFLAEAEKRFGENPWDWKFICPVCGTVQTGRDLEACGVEKSKIEDYIGFSCVGRFDKSKGCDWTLGGLFQIHTLEVEDEGGHIFRRFALAEN